MIENYFILQCKNKAKESQNYYLCDRSYIENNDLFSVV